MRQGIRVMSRGLLAFALFALALGVATGAPPVFKSGVELVNLQVTVTDPTNRFVRDLPQSDFQVLEDGVPQKLALFKEENIPMAISILIDTSTSMHDKLAEAQAAAVSFVKTLRPQDQAQIVQFNEHARILEDFTSDVGKLEAAIRATRAGGATALYTAIYVALRELPTQQNEQDLKRLAIVVLSDGEDTASLVNDEQVLDLARRKGIGVYGISLRDPDADSVLKPVNTSLPTFFFNSLTRDTGGDVHYLKSLAQLKGVYDRFAEELRAQYSMGYISSNAKRDGHWRHVVVRVLNRAGVQVRHRPGYYAPQG